MPQQQTVFTLPPYVGAHRSVSALAVTLPMKVIIPDASACRTILLSTNSIERFGLVLPLPIRRFFPRRRG